MQQRAPEQRHLNRPPLALPRPSIDEAEARRLMEAIASKLLDSIDVSSAPLDPAEMARFMATLGITEPPPASPHPPSAASVDLQDDPIPALTDFALGHTEGRLGFLWALFHHHYRHGLLMAVNHVWASLARPKAVRCQMMAQRLKLPGDGKVALKNVLAAFLQETLYGVEFPPLPDTSDYSSADEWNAACMQHFASIDAEFEDIVSRYEAILDGRTPGEQPTNVIQGPWVRHSQSSSL